MPESLSEDGETFLERADDFAGLAKRDLQTELFRLKSDLSARYEFEVEGFEKDYEARLWTGKEGDPNRAEFVVDLRGGETEINAFVIKNGDVVLNEVQRH